MNGNTIPNATVLLKEGDSNDLSYHRDEPKTDLFEFHDVKPGIPYQLSVSAKGFADWACPPIVT